MKFDSLNPDNFYEHHLNNNKTYTIKCNNPITVMYPVMPYPTIHEMALAGWGITTTA